MQKYKKVPGFTALELLTVIAIIGVVSAIAIPNLLDWLPKHRLNAASRDIIADIHYTRQLAASLNREYRISFTLGTEQYQIEKGDASSGSTWPGTVEGVVRQFADSDNSYYHVGIDIVSVTDLDLNDITAIEFTPLGSMTAAIITLENENDTNAEITTSIAGGVKM